MNIGVVGTGYVGLVQGVVLAEFGMNVVCMDTDEGKIARLREGVLPIYEPGLKEMLDRNVAAGRLRFSTDMPETVSHALVLFIAVGTPPQADGSADLHYVLDVARAIGRSIDGEKVVVDKSTVPVGTGALVRQTIQAEMAARGVDYPLHIVSNPEFLREGKALHDCMLPDRVVVGTDSDRARDIMREVYNVLYINQTPFLFTSIPTAEMIKYASNAFLAVKISFINEMALLAEKVGANVQEIARGMGMDGRISPKFLHAGPGYGGSCFPKDTRAIAEIARAHDERMLVVEAAIAANEKQKQRAAQKVLDALSKKTALPGCVIAMWGLSFKPDTDDMRDAPAIDVARAFAAAGVRIRAYCPQGMREAQWRLSDIADSVEYCADEYAAATGADALVIMTEWHAFRGADMARVAASMRRNNLFDLRNVFARSPEVRAMFAYEGMGIGG